MFIRLTLCAAAALALAAGNPPAEGDAAAAPAIRANWRVIQFRGATMAVPPGVVALSATTFLFGTVEIEVPDHVAVEFNDRGEAVFTLAPGEAPHAFVVRIGGEAYVVSARSRLVVPPSAVGRPRLEANPLAYRVPTPREFLDQGYDLGDPLDASPFR